MEHGSIHSCAFHHDKKTIEAERMMEILFYQIDAFAGRVFSGNPAGVCVLEGWPEEGVLRSIANENNLPETAFLVRKDKDFELRWFTPEMEIDLCGHATLASAHAIFEFLDNDRKQIKFITGSGLLSVERKEGLIFMDFPSRPPADYIAPDGMAEILGAVPTEVMRSRDIMVVFNDENTVKTLSPDLAGLAELDCAGVIVTAPGDTGDFVSRFFAPRMGIPEDHVTGSAHCTLIPYWAKRLAKRELHAFQISKRGGELFCSDKGDRVSIGGRAVTYLCGIIMI